MATSTAASTVNLVPKPKKGPRAYVQNYTGESVDVSNFDPPSPDALLNDDEIIPVKSRAMHKFYEPLVLLKVLNKAAKNTTVPTNLEASIDTEDDNEIFKAFVYKLGHICDSVKRGPTITAFCVLQKDDNLVQYMFASNDRDLGELQDTKIHVQNILGKVQNSFGDQNIRSKLFDSLLVDVLVFNRARIAHYVYKIKQHAEKCKDSKDEDFEQAGRDILETLNELIDCVDFDARNTSEENFTTRSIRLIYELERIKLSDSGKKIAERARQARQMLNVPSKECWSDLQHMANRVLAYAHSVRFILKAKDKWPRLFKKFEISFLKSSKPAPRPSRQKSMNANDIVGRMTRKQDMMNCFQDFVCELQMFNLDRSIMNQYQSNDFEPLVHAEVLLLDQLDKQGLLEPRFFFNNCMYIGSSKPTCKLCNHFFEAYPIKVDHRPTHGNIYISWRFPDLLKSQGQAGEDKKQLMFDKVLKRLRQDAFDIIRKKTPSSYKGEDSFTYSATLPPVARTPYQYLDLEDDDLASMIGQLDID